MWWKGRFPDGTRQTRGAISATDPGCAPSSPFPSECSARLHGDTATLMCLSSSPHMTVGHVTRTRHHPVAQSAPHRYLLDQQP